MKKIWFCMAVVTLAFAACNKYVSPSSDDDTPTPSHQEPHYKVGDYFHNDTLEGVVFLTYSGYSGLMVSLNETQLPWCLPDHINSLTGATNPYDGWRNTNILMSSYDLYNYPAIQWSHLKNTWHLVHYNYPITSRQWFVPANDELRYLLRNQEAVNHTLDSLGYPTLEGKTYWASTELGTRSAAALRVQDSSIVVIETLKDQTLYVRAVRHF